MKSISVWAALLAVWNPVPAPAGEIVDVTLVASALSERLFHTEEPDAELLDAIADYWEATPAPGRDQALASLLLLEGIEMPGRLSEIMQVFPGEQVTEGARKRWSELVRRIEAIARRQTTGGKSTNISSPDRIDFYIPENVLSFRMQNRNAKGGWLHLVGEGANYPGLFFQERTAFIDSASILPPGAIIYQLLGDFMHLVVDQKFQLTITGGGDFLTSSTARLSLGKNGTPSATLDVVGDAKISAGLTIGGDLDVTGDFTVDTDSLYVDATNDRVGVNTAAPAAELDVLGKVRIKGAIGNAILDIESNDGSVAWRHSASQTTGNYTFRDETNAINMLVIEPNGSANQLYLDSSGNVGVGTSSPGEALDVSGNIKASGTVEAGGAVFHGALSSAPSSPNAGDFYFDTTTSKHRGWDGTAWNNFY